MHRCSLGGRPPTWPSMLSALGPVHPLQHASAPHCIQRLPRPPTALPSPWLWDPGSFLPQAWSATPENSDLSGIRVHCPAGALHPLGFIHASVKCGHSDFWDVPLAPSGTLQSLLSRLCLCQPLKSFQTGPCRLLAAALICSVVGSVCHLKMPRLWYCGVCL